MKTKKLKLIFREMILGVAFILPQIVDRLEVEWVHQTVFIVWQGVCLELIQLQML